MSLKRLIAAVVLVVILLAVILGLPAGVIAAVNRGKRYAQFGNLGHGPFYGYRDIMKLEIQKDLSGPRRQNPLDQFGP